MNKCSISECSQPSKYKGMCGMHYKRWWRHKDVNKVITPKNFTRSTCSIEGCMRDTYASNTTLCKMHYLRQYRYGRTYNIIADKGTGTTSIISGYRYVTINGKQVYEHIFLAEKALGRSLPKGAVVHHMNCDRSDNFTKLNLVICPSQGYHLFLHRRLRKLYTWPELDLL